MDTPGDRNRTHLSSPPPDTALAVYLRRHVAAARGGLALFRRTAGSHRDPTTRQGLEELVREVVADRDVLLQLVAELGVSRPRVGEALAAGGELAGRLVPNGTVLRRSAVSDLVEIEALRAAVAAKRSGWASLRDAGAVRAVLSDDSLTSLIERADRQLRRLDDMREATARAALAG